MGRLRLISRLVARDLRRRPIQAVLMLVAIMAATTTLTIGLALGGVTNRPYQQTRQATAGPDVAASYLNLPPMPSGSTPSAGLAALAALARTSGVAAAGGPYPVGWATLRAGSLTAGVMAEGREPARSAIDQPKLYQGSWISADGVVIERSFADALGVHVGELITLDSRPFRVAGIAVTAANVPYPNSDFVTQGTPYPSNECGMIWVTEATARSFATAALPLSYVLNLKLADPARAQAFALAHGTGRFSLLALSPWQQIAQQDASLVKTSQLVLLVGTWLLSLLAIASVAVLVGGQMTEQTRRVGLLKAVGGTPGLVAAVLLAQNLLLALTAAGGGLLAGWLAAPLLTSPGAGLVGTPGAPSLTLETAGWAVAVAAAVAMVATFVPAVRAARTSTVSALADAARSPRRRRIMIAASRRLPAPLLLGVRLVASRPRRSLLTAGSVLVTATTIVAVLTVHAHQARGRLSGFSALSNPRQERVDQVLLVLTVMLIALAAVNAIFITQATVLEARRSTALARALGATPRQVTAALSVAQLIPALPAVLLGVPAGIALVRSVSHGGATTVPPAWWLVSMVLATLTAVAALTAVPARAGMRRPPAEILKSETA